MVNFATVMQAMGELYLEKRLAEEQVQAQAQANAELQARVAELEQHQPDAPAAGPIVLASVPEGGEGFNEVVLTAVNRTDRIVNNRATVRLRVRAPNNASTSTMNTMRSITPRLRKSGRASRWSD